jgi:hypothetical protein
LTLLTMYSRGSDMRPKPASRTWLSHRWLATEVSK